MRLIGPAELFVGWCVHNKYWKYPILTLYDCLCLLLKALKNVHCKQWLPLIPRAVQGLIFAAIHIWNPKSPNLGYFIPHSLQPELASCQCGDPYLVSLGIFFTSALSFFSFFSLHLPQPLRHFSLHWGVGERKDQAFQFLFTDSFLMLVWFFFFLLKNVSLFFPSEYIMKFSLWKTNRYYALCITGCCITYLLLS